MEDYSNYREMPRTGRTPDYSSHERDPQIVDPSVLTDDRENPDLLTFEKTWGHRVLAGLGVAMLVIAVLLVIFCVIQLVRVADIASIIPGAGIVGMYIYGTGLVCGLALVVPACIAIYVAKHPGKVAIAIAAAIVGIALALAFFAYAAIATPSYLATALLYTLLLIALPVVYLIAALKIKRSQ